MRGQAGFILVFFCPGSKRALATLSWPSEPRMLWKLKYTVNDPLLYANKYKA
jgi:hypothetical protein